MKTSEMLKRHLVATATALLVSGAGQASAQGELELVAPDGEGIVDPDDDRQARQLFEKGRVAFQDGNYRDAWDSFHRAYSLSRRPRLLYNVGQAADRLGRDGDALKAFELYLKHMPKADNRREVQNRVRALRGRMRERERPTSVSDSDTSGDDGLGDADNAAFFGDEQDDAPPPPDAGWPTRTGWYTRVGLGLGLLRDALDPVNLTVSSVTGAVEFSLATTVAEGFVIGGGLFLELGLNPKAGDLEIDKANLVMLGPMVDWYLDPTASGWHVQGALVFAALALPGKAAVDREIAGGALILGGGYEWQLDREWGIGALGRLTLSRLEGDIATHGLQALSVLATATWF